jgi:hypothetical protein
VVDLMTARRMGLAALALGLGIAAAAQIAAPLAPPPLYDGVVVVQPYVFVNPPAGKLAGAQGASAHLPMNGHKSPVVVFATPEQPPQAQVVAGDGTLALPLSATALEASITPFDPSVDATAAGAARILGNVYRITIVDQTGAAATAPASGLVTVVLRAPEDVPGAQVGLVVGGTWHPLKSEAMYGSAYVAVVTGFGDFAVIVPGATPVSPSASGAALSSLAPSAPAAGGTSTAAVPPASSKGPGPGGGTGSDGFPPGQMIGALVFLLLAFVGVGAWLRARRRRRLSSARSRHWHARR